MGTSSRNVPASLIRLGGSSIPLTPPTLTSKKLDGTVIIADCNTRLCALRALAAVAAFFVGIKSSSPSESPPPMRLPGAEPPIDFRVLSVACFRLTFLPLESTTALSSHSWHAFCRQHQHVLK